MFVQIKRNKEIMKMSLLRNKFLNTKSDIKSDRKAYDKQHNLCVSLIRPEKKIFFNDISTRDTTDNRAFWKTAKPLQIRYKQIALIEK